MVMLYFAAGVRFVITVIVLSLIGYTVPGFGHLLFGDAVLAALAISVLGLGVQIFRGSRTRKYLCGGVGFIVTGLVIVGGQSVIRHVHVSLLSALVAAAVVGLVNYAIPTSDLKA